MPETAYTKEEIEIINAKQLLTVKEAAVILRLHKISVYRLISKGKLPACRIGQAIRIPKKNLDQFIESQISEAQNTAT